MDQTPDESEPQVQSSHINETRRHRTRRLIIPSGRTERSIYVNEIAKRLVPGLDYYLFSALCGLILAAALLLDHPAVYLLAALLAPFMSPLIGLGFSTAVGSFKFFMQSLGSLAIGAAFIFLASLISGIVSKMTPGFTPSQIKFYTTFSISHLIVIVIGTILAVYITVRVPKQKSVVASVALANEVYLPIGVAGFGLTSGMKDYFISALQLAGINILLVIMIGAVVLVFLKLRPFTTFGYLLTAILLGGAAYALIMSSAIKTSLQPEIPTTALTAALQETENPLLQITVTPQPPTATLLIPMEITATNTLVPTRTPTVTNTPKPAEVWAAINVDQGVFIRQGPCSDEVKCPRNGAAVANKTPVLVLAVSEDNSWIQVRLDDGREGWVNRAYLSFNAQ